MAPAITVRRFEAADAPAVCNIWTAGFMDMAWDLTRHLGAVGSPAASVSFPRPALALAAGLGSARLLVGLVRGERRSKASDTALGLVAAGVGGLALLHFITKRLIRGMCEHEIAAGDMQDIPGTWQRAGESEFFVAVDAAGAVLGCVAVQRGGWQEHYSPDAAPHAESDTSVFSVWKVSTSAAARGRGVAKALMTEAERWARAAGGQTMVLVTASPGAKKFYSRIGYTMNGGSERGAEFSSWTKSLL